MEKTPPPKLDRLALAVHGIAIAVLVGGLVAFGVFLKNRPEPPKPAPPVAKPVAKPIPQKPPTFEGRVLRYQVVVEPPNWRDITLSYSVVREGGHPVAYSDFVHSGGQARFRLGRFETGDPAHANVRFPGFFLHHVYLGQALEPGQKVAWSWAWQPVREGRIKRFEGVVHGWENVKVPHGTHRAARVDLKILYVDKGRTQAESRETIWLAPGLGIVRVLREGAAPDEASRRIVAELAEVK